MKVKGDSEKAGLKLNIQKMKIMAFELGSNMMKAGLCEVNLAAV